VYQHTLLFAWVQSCKYVIIITEGVSGVWRLVEYKTWHNGRIARYYDNLGEKNAMNFRIDADFFENEQTDHPIRVEVTHHDEGIGEWELLYNSPAGQIQAFSVATNGTSEWKKVQIDIPDAEIYGGFQNGADLILKHVSGDDTRFHMIELERL